MKRITSRTLSLCGIVMLAASIVAIACTWSLMTEHSVRFNAFQSGRGFYRLPPLPIMYDPTTGKELSVQEVGYGPYENESYEYENSEPKRDLAGDVWKELQTAIDQGQMANTRHLLEKYLKVSKFNSTDDEEEETIQQRRSSAYDMLDAMTALKQGSGAANVNAYISARKAHDNQTGLPPSDESRKDKSLKDNWAYLDAAELYRAGDKIAAKTAFEEHLAKYPRSEKRESVEYMLAKLEMEASYSFRKAGCGIEGKGMWGKEVKPDDIEPLEKCRDEAWRQAVEKFRLFVRDFPKGRYFNDARGWLAYLYRRGGSRAEALAEYYRLLGSPNDLNARLEAKKSLQIIGHDYDDETLDKVEQLIAGDVDSSMAYAYHRIYNHAIDLTYVNTSNVFFYMEPPYNEADEKKVVDEQHTKGDHELERVARFATSMMRRYPNARVNGGFVLRVAEAQIESKNYADAIAMARKALVLGVDGELRAQALWVKGSCEHEQHDLIAARSTFEKLIAEFPKSKHTEGARRLLAMIAEDRGDFETALDLYLALDYKYDIAYYIDVFMPIDRLAKFVADRPDIPARNDLLYALGVRYMRDKRWNEARETLKTVRTEAGLDVYEYDQENEERFAKEKGWGYGQSKSIKTEWVMQDLKTIDTLENFERAIEIAPDDEAKAEVMYQLAGFQFAANDLLFYNPAAWQGLRAMLLNQLQFGNDMRVTNESEAIFDHSQSHDTIARAIPIYLEIANRYPNTRAAKDALYSAAVAHERLSNLNDYWRTVYGRNLFAGPRMVTYADVRSAYPHYQLPRGTDGWDPATRTVNGGPGWAPRPKPLPRETREHKVKRLLTELGEYVSTTITTGVVPKIETKIHSGIDWSGSIIEEAVYGILSGIGLWALILIGVGLHSQRVRTQLLPSATEHTNADSRVDKFIE